MYCPRCASTAVAGQRFCRNCGTNLGLIFDAIDDRRGPIDFESLKSDLRDLGASLRAGFEEARQNFTGPRGTQRLQTPPAPAVAPLAPIAPSAVEPLKIKQVRGGSTRRRSLQQATLSIFSGGALTAVLYHLFQTAGQSGLLASIERALQREAAFADFTGIAPVLSLLWLIGLLPLAKGAAYLINGIFFPDRPEPAVDLDGLRAALAVPAPAQSAAYAAPVRATTTNDLEPEPAPPSVTEEETIRFGSREPH
jgi:hypothetical protein